MNQLRFYALKLDELHCLLIVFNQRVWYQCETNAFNVAELKDSSICSICKNDRNYICYHNEERKTRRSFNIILCKNKKSNLAESQNNQIEIDFCNLPNSVVNSSAKNKHHILIPQKLVSSCLNSAYFTLLWRSFRLNVPTYNIII